MLEHEPDDIVACIVWLKRSLRCEVVTFEEIRRTLEAETKEEQEKLAELLRSMRERGTLKYSKDKGWMTK